ncbi:hypothetical protein [Chitinasiproducens palmae]|uniref:hypothetical protein n=1 Tax=Chitinasiproducens palmae TaxID=1770053 RepID=UPI001B8C7B79|nr:hypothetical protein [Chitinasiproducens palmae]
MKICDYDWGKIVSDLHRQGMQRVDILRALHGLISESTLRAYASGVHPQPSHWRGELLLNLWCDRTGANRTDAPTRPAHIDGYCERRVRKLHCDMSANSLATLEALFRPLPDLPIDAFTDARRKRMQP